MKYLKLKTLIYIVAVIIACQSCDSCNPRTGMLAIVKTWDVPPGETYSFTSSPGGSASVDFIARVFYAAKDSLTDSLTNGPHPLVIFGHGRYGPTAGSGYPNNYLHAAYLMNQLASWGYVCVSVNFDVVHSFGSSAAYGIPHRGELFLHAIDYMEALNADNTSIFYNKLDLSRIGLIGHSRGGGGAVSAVNLNQSQGSPRNIRALATISPTSFSVNPVSGDMPQLMLFGTWDGDLSDAQGYGMWDAAPRDKQKVFVEIYGANHFYFSDDLVYSGETQDISRENHQNMAKGFINAFFDQHLRQRYRYKWPDYLSYKRKVDTVDYYVQYLSDTIEVVDNGNPLGTPTVNNLTGANDGATLTLFDDRALSNPAEGQYGNTNGLRASWNAAGDSLSFTFPSTNVSSYQYVAFRLGQRHGQPGNTVNTFKNINVKLTDSSGGSMVIPLKNSYYKGIQYPDQAVYPGGPDGYKNIPSSFRVSLNSFTGVDLTGVVRITLLFDVPNDAGYVNNTGSITVDDVEFSM